MTEKLDPFAPTKERILGIKRQLLRAGIPEEAIPLDWFPAILAADEKWLATTDEGLQYVCGLLDIKTKYGDTDKVYTLVDNVSNTQSTLKNNQVVFFEGVLVSGRPVALMDPSVKQFIPPLELEISEIDKNKCDSCGIVSHCLKEVLEPFSERLEHLCNYCLTHNEHPRINSMGGFDVCQECTVYKCQHHPYPERNKG